MDNRRPSPSFKEYEVIQYITSAELAPWNILPLDSNGEIVLAARVATTRAGLKALGIPFSESQIALLKTFRLLEEREDTLRTLFPILGPEQTRRLRQQVRAVAPALARRLEPEVSALRRELSRAGREKNASSIIFSYVLDGLVWDEFAERRMLHKRELTVETPLWAGQVWALYPPRPAYPGINSLSDRGISFKVTWTKEALPLMRPFVADIPTLVRMFDDYQSQGFVKDMRALEVFGPFDLFDDSGHFTIPVIDERESNALHRSAQATAASVAKGVPSLLSLSELAKDSSFVDQEQALIIV